MEIIPLRVDETGRRGRSFYSAELPWATTKRWSMPPQQDCLNRTAAFSCYDEQHRDVGVLLQESLGLRRAHHIASRGQSISERGSRSNYGRGKNFRRGVSRAWIEHVPILLPLMEKSLKRRP